MHIRKLDLQGFKSFPDRTSFHFAPGVSGVVGPNGCGKSNVVDAVKWCLGEQSAKSLRGKCMEDVIFAGSESRTAVGAAEVTLTFASGDEPFPGEYARCEELQITRRLFRDGTSEYLINQHRVRLKDIQDVFRDTGAGNRLYSFIEQGRIGEIVKARPEQRRSLIEEAAGISGYKARKREAESRLDGTLHNLERATDLVDDLTGRLRSLRRQVARATRYRRFRTEVRQGEIFLGLARFSGLVGDRRALVERVREAQAEETAQHRELQRQEEGISQEREALSLMGEGVGRLRDRLGELEATRREQESARIYQGRESEQLQKRIERLEVTRVQAEADHGVAGERRAEAEAERAEVEAVAATSQSQADQDQRVAREAEEALHARRERIEEGKAKVLDLVRQIAREKSAQEAARIRADDLGTRHKDLIFRIEVARGKQEDHHRSAGTATAADEAAQAAVDEAEELAAAALDAQSASDTARTTASSALQDAQDVRQEADRQVDRARTRLELLQGLQQAHDGVQATVRKALEVTGVMGTLADHLDVPADMEELVATALGGELEHVLVPDAKTALKVAAATGARVGMLLVPDGVVAGEGLAGTIPGTAVGRRALDKLVGRCTEVQDLEAALARHAADGGAYVVRRTDALPPILVTTRGEIHIGPATSGGTSVLQRRREIADLASVLPGLVGAADGSALDLGMAQEAVRKTEGAWEVAQAALANARAAMGEARFARRSTEAQLHHVNAEHRRQQDRLDALKAQRDTLSEDLERLASSATDLGGSIDQAIEAQMEVETALQALQVALLEDETRFRDARQVAIVAATELAGVQERLRGLTRIEDAARQAEEGASRQVQSCTRDIEAARARILSLATDDQRLNQTLQQIGEEQAALRTRMEEEREQVRRVREGLAEAEESIRTLRDARESATATRTEIEHRIDQVKADIVHIRAQLDERYQVSVAALLDRLERNGQIVVEVPEEAIGPHLDPEADPELQASAARVEVPQDLVITPPMLEQEPLLAQWIERLQHARSRLERLGEVNLVAVQEYTEVKERFDQLEAQRTDLEESVRAIRNSIAKLNRTCRERFRETFERVDALFQEGYPRLVGGGKARLVLTDQDDMLETGVDIEVQPPGKRLQNVSLLSGGEMAMAAIALIFALFRVKPSPFCLLDEVDAPLDEANGARFNGLLREMARVSQFIVITHNKKTMECVDTLYGVTMNNPGVSQLVSVKLD